MKVVFILLAVIIIAAVGIYAYYGGFKKISLQIREEGGETLVYEEVKGDYKNTAAVMDKIYYSLLNDENIETFKGFGIYYDDPKKVDKEKLRSEAGCILEYADRDNFREFEKQYQLKTFPKKQYLTAEFPWKGKMSVMFSILKVYPALNKYVRANGYDVDTAVMEIYDIPNGKILYRKDLKSAQEQ
ncbi:MAG: GyrI-like domain-containing protein [Bacteroidales bacterium]